MFQVEVVHGSLVIHSHLEGYQVVASPSQIAADERLSVMGQVYVQEAYAHLEEGHEAQEKFASAVEVCKVVLLA
jgi:hypothetical protein